jgi:hypothetical protein
VITYSELKAIEAALWERRPRMDVHWDCVRRIRQAAEDYWAAIEKEYLVRLKQAQKNLDEAKLRGETKGRLAGFRTRLKRAAQDYERICT